MGRYLLRRLLIAIPSLIGISIVLFTVLALAPGDPFGELATSPDVPPEVRAALRVKFGLDDPIPIRYLRWFAAMLHGEWGFSFVSRVDVDTLVLQRLPTTIFVIGSSQVLALLIALPVGIYAAVRPYSIFDQIASTLTFIGFPATWSVPMRSSATSVPAFIWAPTSALIPEIGRNAPSLTSS